MATDFFERLIAEAEQAPFSGWDFSHLRDRMWDTAPDWDYPGLVRQRMAAARTVLDLGTGGGEFLAGLAPLPPRTVATEAYPPNVALARARLAPHGVEVVAVEGAPDNVLIAPGVGVGTLPFPDGDFPLVINRHESYYPAEIARILQPGGTFLTQQVGGAHHQDLHTLLGASGGFDARWNLAFAVAQVEAAGLRVIGSGEAYPVTTFCDIGAIVYYLKAIPWHVPGFSVVAYRDRLAALHARIVEAGSLSIRGHLFSLEAVKGTD